MTYLKATSILEFMNSIEGIVVGDLPKDFNVITIGVGGSVLLFKVQPPNRLCKSLSLSTGESYEIDVKEVFNYIQKSCLMWAEY